ncbi:hypothetical protein [Micromonospora sp. NPDC023737]
MIKLNRACRFVGVPDDAELRYRSGVVFWFGDAIRGGVCGRWRGAGPDV